jgi:hypothetical protein
MWPIERFVRSQLAPVEPTRQNGAMIEREVQIGAKQRDLADATLAVVAYPFQTILAQSIARRKCFRKLSCDAGVEQGASSLCGVDALFCPTLVIV